MPNIHPTAIVDSKAELGEQVSIGPYAVIEGDVVIDEGTEVHSHVLVAEGARIGKKCVLHHSCVVSTLPQDLKFGGEKTLMEIGDETVIREFCTLNRGTKDRDKSRIGSSCLLMAYSHVAHDCFVGDKVIMANGVQLGGHVTVEDNAVLGGLVAVHQFCNVGRHSMVGGCKGVVKDVPPYVLAAGEPVSFKGLNVTGLKRRGFSSEVIRELRNCYRIIYRSGLNTSQALEKLSQMEHIGEEVKAVIGFFRASERGVIR